MPKEPQATPVRSGSRLAKPPVSAQLAGKQRLGTGVRRLRFLAPTERGATMPRTRAGRPEEAWSLRS